MLQHRIRHTLQLATTTILALGCMFYPFMPGPHDRMAATLSMMAQVLGLTGLVMVPIGIIWLTYELAMVRARRQGSVPRTAKGHWLAFCAMTASAMVAAAVALAAATHTGPSLAVVVLMLWVYIIRRALAGVRRMRIADDGRLNPAPVYLILVPCILVIARLTFLPVPSNSAASAP